MGCLDKHTSTVTIFRYNVNDHRLWQMSRRRKSEVMAMIEKVVDKRSKIPYYYQLADILREFIEQAAQGDSKTQEDHLLPSETELARTHRLSRATVRQAFDLLEREGL